MELRVAIEKQFGNFTMKADFTATGRRIGIFGESGSGKSTLVGLIAGLHQPDRGEIFVDGECLFSSSKRINVPTQLRRIGMVFQQPALFPHLSVRSNLLYGFTRCAPQYRLIDSLSLVESSLKLEGLLKRGVNNLSGGEKQRVALARAVLANPRLLLMDEPLSALDDDLKFQIIPYLRNVGEQFGIPYFFISHSMTEMRLMTDDVIVLDQGRVVEFTSAEELARQRMGVSRAGYINILRLRQPQRVDGLYEYRWGNGRLLVSAGSGRSEGIFELSSKDIILFKTHPEAISARNLLKCRVAATFPLGNRTGVELRCGDERLVAEVAEQATEELDIREGVELYAAIKGSAFRERGGR